jgi:NAD+--asparagine ADP-ribosyltransferase
MLQAAARVAHNVKAETRAREIRERAARKAGELSKKIEKAHGNRYSSSTK